MYGEKQLANKQTITQLVAEYEKSREEIIEGYRLLNQAQKRLNDAFGPYTSYGNFDTIDRYNHSSKAEDIIKKITRSVWAILIENLGVHKIASIKRRDEISKKIEDGKLPDPTVENIYAIFQTLIQNQDEFAREAVKEVFEILRPRNGEYKTNSLYEIGKRVILSWFCEGSYSYQTPFRVNYSHEKDLIALDKVFYLLDGKGIPDGYRSPLVDAINTSTTGQGETEYFKFKCHYNRNLHLEFKRLDLLEKLNQIASGAVLKPQNKR